MSSDPSRSIRLVAAAVGSAAALAIVIWFGLYEREPPLTCPDGLDRVEARCCGKGQSFAEGRCAGELERCAPGFRIAEGGCVLEEKRIPLSAGRLPRGAADFQVSASERELELSAFAIDRGEVTVARYAACVRAKQCAPLAEAREAGLPVAGLDPEQAERFCRFAGGRLPTSAEWRYAASGSEGRRFPWGFTGLVCRRAAFGLIAGPCGTDGAGPDLAGARPDGQTPEGVLDLSGNVAEWTRDPKGGYRARGGSFRSRVAAELVTAAVEAPARGDRAHVGFRCAYSTK